MEDLKEAIKELERWQKLHGKEMAPPQYMLIKIAILKKRIKEQLKLKN